MSKLISEADKLLEKGKIPEALEKLKAALKEEPLNQLVATKLANVYVEKGEAANAAKVYISLAGRLSDAGKAQVAIAIYKQALDLDPSDIELKVKFAIECESVGKIGDAQVQANLALQYYLRRKKYFDATNIFPLLARIQTKDEKVKVAWVEVIQLSQAEQKLVHLLVAICGPPGLVSQEFPTGGDPATISESLYESLKKLVPFFPRDPKIAYALAWAAHRRGKDRDFYHYLRECLRREPDFCLALFLYARLLAEKEKLNESLFIYKYLKERMPSDKSSDQLTLNRLLEGFVEKNGWISFTEGMGVEELDASGFLAAIAGQSAAKPESEVSAPATPAATAAIAPPPIPGTVPSPVNASQEEVPIGKMEESDVPAEIELSLGPGDDEGMELQLSNAPLKKIVPAQAAAPLTASTPVAAPTPATAPAAPSATPSPVPETPLVERTGSVEFTSIIKVTPEEPSVQTELPPEAAPSGAVAQAPQEVAAEAPVAPARKTFNPLDPAVMSPADLRSTSRKELEERTQMFSPIDILGASNIVQNEISKVQTQATLIQEDALAAKAASENALPSSTNEVRALDAEGTGTKLYSPFEAVDAGVASRKPYTANESQETKILVSPAPAEIAANSPASEPENLVIVPQAPMPDVTKLEALSLTESEPLVDPLDALANAEGEATMMINLGSVENQSLLPAADEDPFAIQFGSGEQQPATSIDDEQGTMVLRRDEFPEPIAADEVIPEEKVEPASGGAFMKIPEAQAASPELSGEVFDLGDDLLDGPTKMLIVKPNEDATAHLFKEIKRDLREKKIKSTDNVEYMLKKAERYIAKRNYYLARKALRHSLALGGDEQKIKARLSDIRKLEMPESLYNNVSSDDGSKEGSSEILDRLEQEFDLKSRAEDFNEQEMSASVETQLEGIFQDSDPRTILDFGVALHEMGLFRQAELVFSRMVDEFPETAFDAYYLAAVSKFSRKDYAGAASILKKLSNDGGKSEIEKIQIYYALGELFEKMRRPERSKEFYRKVADLDANYRNIRHKLEE